MLGELLEIAEIYRARYAPKGEEYRVAALKHLYKVKIHARKKNEKEKLCD